MFTWMFNCREVNRMISASMDSELSLAQRILIRFHLMMCRGCGQVRNQILSLRAYSRYLGSADAALENLLHLSPESCRRMKAEIQRAQTEITEQ